MDYSRYLVLYSGGADSTLRELYALRTLRVLRQVSEEILNIGAKKPNEQG